MPKNPRGFRFKPNRVALASACALLFLGTVDSVAQQTKELSTVVVNLQDPGGNAISAYVRLFPTSVRTTEPTGGGGVSFLAKPGKYDLFVETPGFREVATRIDVLASPRTVVRLTLQLGGCPPGPCSTIMPWEASTVLSVSDGESPTLTLRAADLKPLKRYGIAFDDPDKKTTEHYSGFSLADVLEVLCGPRHCLPSRGDAPQRYVVVTANGGFIVFPLANLIPPASEGKILIADALGGRTLPNNCLRAFLIANERVTESVLGIVGVRLVTPH